MDEEESNRRSLSSTCESTVATGSFGGKQFAKSHLLSFESALSALKQGKKVTRKTWNGFYAELQIPDDRSKMTLPYIYMVKNRDKFPLDMSCESILANDWGIVSNL